MRWRTTLIIGFTLLSQTATAQVVSRADAAWPCQQALVPVLTPAKMWDGPAIDGIGDWHGEPRVAALVQRISPRDVSAQTGEGAIDEFVRSLGPDRTHAVLLAFAGLLDETNRERTQVVERIQELGERQHNLATLIGHLTAELDAMPPNPQGEAVASRDELQQRWTFNSRTYADVQRTMRYACQVPASLETRLKAYAHRLEAALP